jgi:hypothetical protein
VSTPRPAAVRRQRPTGSSPRARSDGSERPRHLRAVRATPDRRRRVPFLFVSFLLVGSLVTAIVTVQVLVSQGSFRVADQSKATAELEERNWELRGRIAELSAPGRIVAEARDIGLRPRGPVEVLVVEGTGPGRATASDGTGGSP